MDSNIHIVFRLISDSSYLTEKKKIESIIRELFGDDFVLEHEDSLNLDDTDLVYRIFKPTFKAERTKFEFFKKLEKLFEETERFLPSFTQDYGVLS